MKPQKRNRPRFYDVHSTLRYHTYSDTAAVTSCSMQSQSVREVMNCNKLNKVLSILHLQHKGIRQEVEQIRANVFIQRFFYFSRTFLADRTNGRAIGTVLRLSVCLSVCL